MDPVEAANSSVAGHIVYSTLLDASLARVKAHVIAMKLKQPRYQETMAPISSRGRDVRDPSKTSNNQPYVYSNC